MFTEEVTQEILLFLSKIKGHFVSLNLKFSITKHHNLSWNILCNYIPCGRSVPLCTLIDGSAIFRKTISSCPDIVFAFTVGELALLVKTNNSAQRINTDIV